MNNLKWRYGIAVSLVAGLSACNMNGNNPQNVDYGMHQSMKSETGTHAHHKHHNMPVKGQGTSAKHMSSNHPAQKVTPGPKRAAAPQIPVIQ